MRPALPISRSTASVTLRSRATGFAGGSGAYAAVIPDAEGEDDGLF